MWKKKIHRDIYTSVTSCPSTLFCFPKYHVGLPSLLLSLQMKKSEVSGSKLDDTLDVCVFGTFFSQMMVMVMMMMTGQVCGPFPFVVVILYGSVGGDSRMFRSDLFKMINEVCSTMQGK